MQGGAHLFSQTNMKVVFSCFLNYCWRDTDFSDRRARDNYVLLIDYTLTGLRAAVYRACEESCVAEVVGSEHNAETNCRWEGNNEKSGKRTFRGRFS